MRLHEIYLIFSLIITQEKAFADHNAFHSLVSLVTDETKETLNRDGLEKLLKTLQGRFPESKCFTLDIINNALANGTGGLITEENFIDVSTSLLYFTTKTNCTMEDTETMKLQLLKGNTKANMTAIEDILDAMKLNDYHHEGGACFNAFTLLDGRPSAEPADIFTRLIIKIYQGGCIFPHDTYFKSQLLSYLNANEGYVTKTGFHELMKKIGIGKIAHDDEDDHREHKRKRRAAHQDGDERDTRCYSSGELFSIFNVGTNVSVEKVLEMCPALVQQLSADVCSAPKTSSDNNTTKYTKAMIYGYGTAAVAIISLLALGGMLMFPILNSTKYKLAMQFFVALGVSTMASDALLHIVPYILGIHHEEDDTEHNGAEDNLTVWRMATVLGGIYIFFLFEQSLRLWKRLRNNSILAFGHSHEQTAGNYHDHSNHHSTTSFSSTTNVTDDTIDTNNQKFQDAQSDIAVSEEMLSSDEVICFGFSTVCVMVFIGDVLHNFGDGIAIGVSFASSWPTGVGTSLAIFCHELPHEFGDFAIYLNAGASKWKAIMLNGIAACCAFIGLYLGISISNEETVRQWLMSAIAGMFLYIALVEVMHEMLVEVTSKPKLQFVLQNIGLLIGFAILLLIAIYEEDLEHSITG